MSGLACAARLAQLGIEATVLDKYKGLVAHGAHVASVGSEVQRANGVYIDKAQFARDWMHICGSRVDESLLWLYINKSEEAFHWLLEMGKDNVTPLLFGGNYKGPDFTEYAGTHFLAKTPTSIYRYQGAFLVCEILEGVARDGGAHIVRNTCALQLEKSQGRVVAAIARAEDGSLCRYQGRRAVVLATGDIGSDPEMLAHFSPLGTLPKRNGYYPAGLNTGDGHRMGRWAGGAFETAPWALSLHLIAYALYSFFFLHVNRQGRRFMNEDTWVQAKAVRILMQANNEWAWSIFDANYYEDVAARAEVTGGQFTDPMICVYGEAWDSEHNDVRASIEKYVRSGLCCKADTLEELAEQMEVPIEEFLVSVARYNELVASGQDVDYGKRSELLTSIAKPPFYALKVGPALLNVFGGLLTDTKLRVLNEEREPIPGLLAVGNVAGGLYGVDYPLLLNGNSNGRNLTWGKLAAETIARGEA
jgi:succinate dehydrogenase/fumarate reductase flavoprotein subunit